MKPTDEQKSRFRTALSVLGLEPFIYILDSSDESQTTTEEDLERGEKMEDRVALEHSSGAPRLGEAFHWPELTMLTSGTVHALPFEPSTL